MLKHQNLPKTQARHAIYFAPKHYEIKNKTVKAAQNPVRFFPYATFIYIFLYKSNLLPAAIVEIPLLSMVRPPNVIKPLGAAPHDPMEDLPHLLLQWIQPILHSLKDIRHVLHSLPHLLFLLSRQRELS